MDQRLQANSNQPVPAASLAGNRIAFIQACWHKEIVDRGRESFVAALQRLGGDAARVDLFEVPGSFEIPLQAKLLARSGRYAAIVACGLVVDGGIYRHEFVASAVIDAFMRLQMEMEVPIISMVLTPQHYHDHAEHRAFFREHFVVKGEEAASACLRTMENLAQLRA
jgi:6,7-dimethyl-8-ribityllumazine synthase